MKQNIRNNIYKKQEQKASQTETCINKSHGNLIIERHNDDSCSPNVNIMHDWFMLGIENGLCY